MSNPVKKPTRRVHLADQKWGERRKHAPPCADRVPDAPAVVLLFDTVERDRHDRIRAKVEWDEILINEDLSDANIDHYVVQLQASNDGIQWDDNRIRRHVVKSKELNEVQKLVLSGFGAGDSFKLTHNGNESGQITFNNATAAEVKNKLEALSSIGDGNVSVRGVKGGPYVVTFKGDHVNEDMTSISITSTVGCTGSIATIQNGGLKTRFNFHNIKKRFFYRARVKGVNKNGCDGLWSNWTNPATPDDNTPPASPTSLTLDVDEHRATIKWDYPDESADPDVPSIDVQFFVVQFAEVADFSVLLFKDRTVSQHRSFRVKKPGNKTFYARVRAVDASLNKSAWVSTSATKHTPSSPAPPSVSFAKVNKRWRAIVTATTVSDTDREIARYPLQLVHKPTHVAPTTGDKRHHGFVEGDATGDDLSETFRSIPADHYVYVRERARDTMGKFSAWSAWTDAGQPALAEDADSGEDPGSIKKHAGAGTPAGWLRCNGATYSTGAPYDLLFAAIGYTYGPPASGSTFAVPDMRGRHVRGVKDAESLGSNEGLAETSRDSTHDKHRPHATHGGHTGHGGHNTHNSDNQGDDADHTHGGAGLSNSTNPNTTGKAGSTSLAAGPNHGHNISGSTSARSNNHSHPHNFRHDNQQSITGHTTHSEHTGHSEHQTDEHDNDGTKGHGHHPHIKVHYIIKY